MAIVVPSGQLINFEYSIYSGDNTRPVAMKIYDLSSGTAVLVTTVVMASVFNGTYVASYTFPESRPNKNYLIQKSVFTDNTYTTPDGTYSPGSEIVQIDGFSSQNGVTA